jgi:hypothetical protein
MLENMYQNFGIFGSLVISILVFLLVVFWIAGIAGITDAFPTKTKYAKIALCVLFPPYPITWLMLDMIRQYKAMHG